MLLTHTSTTALWYDLIQHGEQQCSIVLTKELEAYLVFLMMRYVNKPELISKIIATSFMQALSQKRKVKEERLQAIGDQCLLLAGLFPNIVKKRLVKLSYYVKMGQNAYIGLSLKKNDLYAGLSKQFISLMDILQSIKANDVNSSLLPLEAYELWQETGSKQAFLLLKKEGKSIPVVKSDWDFNN